MLAKEPFYEQRSHIKWISLGDHNTGFFHKSLRLRTARNTIKVLFDRAGRKLDSPGAIAKEIVDFYKNLLGTADPSVAGGSIPHLRGILQFELSSIQSASLIPPITDEEIKGALWSIDSNSAPGPDGYSSHFLKSAWNIVG